MRCWGQMLKMTARMPFGGKHNKTQVEIYHLGGGIRYFVKMFTPCLGKRSNLTSIFFRWVETTNLSFAVQEIFGFLYAMILKKMILSGKMKFNRFKPLG